MNRSIVVSRKSFDVQLVDQSPHLFLPIQELNSNSSGESPNWFYFKKENLIGCKKHQAMFSPKGGLSHWIISHFKVDVPDIPRHQVKCAIEKMVSTHGPKKHRDWESEQIKLESPLAPFLLHQDGFLCDEDDCKQIFANISEIKTHAADNHKSKLHGEGVIILRNVWFHVGPGRSPILVLGSDNIIDVRLKMEDGKIVEIVESNPKKRSRRDAGETIDQLDGSSQPKRISMSSSSEISSSTTYNDTASSLSSSSSSSSSSPSSSSITRSRSKLRITSPAPQTNPIIVLKTSKPKKLIIRTSMFRTSDKTVDSSATEKEAQQSIENSVPMIVDPSHLESTNQEASNQEASNQEASNHQEASSHHTEPSNSESSSSHVHLESSSHVHLESSSHLESPSHIDDHSKLRSSSDSTNAEEADSVCSTEREVIDLIDSVDEEDPMEAIPMEAIPTRRRRISRPDYPNNIFDLDYIENHPDEFPPIEYLVSRNGQYNWFHYLSENLIGCKKHQLLCSPDSASNHWASYHQSEHSPKLTKTNVLKTLNSILASFPDVEGKDWESSTLELESPLLPFILYKGGTLCNTRGCKRVFVTASTFAFHIERDHDNCGPIKPIKDVLFHHRTRRQNCNHFIHVKSPGNFTPIEWIDVEISNFRKIVTQNDRKNFSDVFNSNNSQRYSSNNNQEEYDDQDISPSKRKNALDAIIRSNTRNTTQSSHESSSSSICLKRSWVKSNDTDNNIYDHEWLTLLIENIKSIPENEHVIIKAPSEQIVKSISLLLLFYKIAQSRGFLGLANLLSSLVADDQNKNAEILDFKSQSILPIWNTKKTLQNNRLDIFETRNFFNFSIGVQALGKSSFGNHVQNSFPLTNFSEDVISTYSLAIKSKSLYDSIPNINALEIETSTESHTTQPKKINEQKVKSSSKHAAEFKCKLIICCSSCHIEETIPKVAKIIDVEDFS